MLKVFPLFSGSKGNCTLIVSPEANLLLDAGFSYREVLKALSERNLKPEDIDAIVITHEHRDHIGTLLVWGRHIQTPVYAPSEIVDNVQLRTGMSEVHGTDGSFDIKDIHIERYRCSHDSICCFGYKFVCGNSRFACVTDTGIPTNEMTEFLSDCKAVMLESNHDEDMLKRGEYTFVLKQRILSPYGHLSNAQAAQVLKQLVGTRVRTVILSHLSENNNTKELAFNCAVNACLECGAVEGRDIDIYVADQYHNEVCICLD